jgi:hypothetical protein
MKTKATSAMVVLIITLVVFSLLRLAIYFFIAEPGIILEVDRRFYSFPKGLLILLLWAFLGFPGVVISIFLLWERRRSRALTSERVVSNRDSLRRWLAWW